MVSDTVSNDQQHSQQDQPRPLPFDGGSIAESRSTVFRCSECKDTFDTRIERDHHKYHCNPDPEMELADANAEHVERALVDERRAARTHL